MRSDEDTNRCDHCDRRINSGSLCYDCREERETKRREVSKPSTYEESNRYEPDDYDREDPCRE